MFSRSIARLSAYLGHITLEHFGIQIALSQPADERMGQTRFGQCPVLLP
jgi:hypothetical protein